MKSQRNLTLSLTLNHSKVAPTAKRTASQKLAIPKGVQHVCRTTTNLTLLLRHSATNLQATAGIYDKGHSKEVDVTKAGIQITYRLPKNEYDISTKFCRTTTKKGGTLYRRMKYIHKRLQASASNVELPATGQTNAKPAGQQQPLPESMQANDLRPTSSLPPYLLQTGFLS